jgi:hypothetical protein
MHQGKKLHIHMHDDMMGQGWIHVEVSLLDQRTFFVLPSNLQVGTLRGSSGHRSSRGCLISREIFSKRGGRYRCDRPILCDIYEMES